MLSGRESRIVWALLAAIAALAVGAIGGFVARPMVMRPQSADPANNAGPPDAIAALGRVQPLRGVIPVYGPPGDRIGRMYDVSVGQSLTAGNPIADLASGLEREKEVKISELQLAEVEQQLALAKAVGEAKVAAAELEADQLGADEVQDKKLLALPIDVLARQHRQANAQLERLRKLTTQGVKVSDEEREQVELLLAKVGAELEGARLKQEKAIAGYERGRKLAAAKLSAARADLAEATARAPIRSTKEKLALARQMLALTTIKAPVSGTVLKVASRAGEPTGAQQPILYLADTSRMVVVAELYESDVPRLRAGFAKGHAFTAAVSSPAFSRDVRWKGAIRSDDQLARMIARNSIFALSPREDTDRRVIEAAVELDAESSKVAADYIGMQVSVELTPERK